MWFLVNFLLMLSSLNTIILSILDFSFSFFIKASFFFSFHLIKFLEILNPDFYFVLIISFILITICMFWNLFSAEYVTIIAKVCRNFLTTSVLCSLFLYFCNNLSIFPSNFFSFLGFFSILIFSLFIFSINSQSNFLFEQVAIFFLFVLVWSFMAQTSSLIMFYLVLEIFSIYFFFSIFNQKNISNNFSINFYCIFLNVVASISFLFFMYVYYAHTGCLNLIPAIAISFPAKTILSWLFFLFLILKFGFFLILPIYSIFYGDMPKKAFFISNVLIKTFVLYFYFENTLSFEILFSDESIFKQLIFALSIFISIFLGKLFAKPSPIIFLYLVSFSSLQLLLLLLWKHNNSELLINISQYYLLSSLFFLGCFMTIQYNEFLFSILFYLGFPGIVFFAKISLFESIFLNQQFLILIFPVFLVILLLFVQEFWFSKTKATQINCLPKASFVYTICIASEIGFVLF